MYGTTSQHTPTKVFNKRNPWDHCCYPTTCLIYAKDCFFLYPHRTSFSICLAQLASASFPGPPGLCRFLGLLLLLLSLALLRLGCLLLLLLLLLLYLQLLELQHLGVHLLLKALRHAPIGDLPSGELQTLDLSG
jgi:hypothetical protein